MQKVEFIVKNKQELIKAIIDELPFLSRYDVKKIIENKDVKINNVRIKENIEVKNNDKITVFYTEKEQKEWFTLVYKDENIIILNKKSGIEVISEAERDLVSILRKEYASVSAVHRLDRNTEGLVIFALNKKAETELNKAFKTRTGITKMYALLVDGRVDISQIKRTVYLKKVPELSKVWISELKTSGYDPIVTEFSVLEYRGNQTLMEANLVTGKTHQIRAHIAYYGYPIVGDNKYGKSNEKELHLTANFLKFNFKKDSLLAYLNSKNFEIIPSWL